MSQSFSLKSLVLQAKERIIVQALECYLKRVKDERAMEGLEVGKELITKDISKITKDLEEAIRLLNDGSDVSAIMAVLSKKEVICDALVAYEIGLKETQEAYWKHVRTRPKLESVDNAIIVVRDLKREFCSHSESA